jgi:hypothetical protein
MGIEPRNLQHNEMPIVIETFIPNVFDILNIDVQMSCSTYGVVGLPGNVAAPSTDFETGLFNSPVCLQSSRSILLTFGQFT